jgi:hypothetical protein
MDITNFEIAFDSGGGSCWERCECGKTFYGSESDWDWEDGEYENFENDENAVPSEYDGVARVYFEGTFYVTECSCWHERAKKVMRFLDTHAEQIGVYFNLERERRVLEANKLPNLENKQ